MRFRFIRVSDKPVDELCSQLDLYECFMSCTHEVRDRLHTFLSGKEESVTFEFEGQTVIIERNESLKVKNLKSPA